MITPKHLQAKNLKEKYSLGTNSTRILKRDKARIIFFQSLICFYKLNERAKGKNVKRKLRKKEFKRELTAWHKRYI